MSSGDDDGSPLIACLLPVRNGEALLPGWFESVSRFADVVVALDDGSTDRTRELLEAEPLVARTLTNPRRPTYAGWDDAGNRQRLLDAAADLRPRWIMALDADERIPADDAAALRRLAEREGLPGFAYGFRVFRMIGDEQHYDRSDLWVYRMFAFAGASRLPSERLHLVPIPVSIPRSRWLRTTVRIQHLASVDERSREIRHRKYREADPEGVHQRDYGHLLDEPGELRRWHARAPGAPLLLDGPEGSHEALDELAELSGPVLSAIVISRDDESVIEEVVRSVVGQRCAEPFEVIVVTSGTDRTAAIVRERFPQARLIELGEPASPGRARNAGLAVARGDYVSFPGSHVVLPAGSLSARIRAHEAGWEMVTGSTLNGTDTPAGWASYFLDHASVLPGRPSEELHGPPAHCSYMRHLLEAVGGFPEDRRTGEDTVVNVELFQRGHRAYRAREVELVHRSPCRTPSQLAVHHFERGRGFGRILLDRAARRGHLLDASTARELVAEYVPRRLAAIRDSVAAWGEGVEDRYERARPLITLGSAAAWCGLWAELMRPTGGKRRVLFGTPGVTILLAGLDRRLGETGGRADALLLAHVDLVRPGIRLVSLPRDLLIEIADHGTVRVNEVHHLAGVRRRGAARSVDPERADHRAPLHALRDAVERVVDLSIDGAVSLDMVQFRALVDALGGLPVEVTDELDEPLADEGMGLRSAEFAVGPDWFDGDRALAFARARPDGDDERRRRHLQLLTALAEQVRTRKGADLVRTMLRLRGHADVALPRSLVRTLALNAPRLRRARITTSHVGEPVVAVARDDDRWVQVADPIELHRAVVDGLGLPRSTGRAPDA